MQTNYLKMKNKNPGTWKKVFISVEIHTGQKFQCITTVVYEKTTRLKCVVEVHVLAFGMISDLFYMRMRDLNRMLLSFVNSSWCWIQIFRPYSRPTAGLTTL